MADVLKINVQTLHFLIHARHSDLEFDYRDHSHYTIPLK